MENVCRTCGEQNPPGTQFCWSCRAYLGWQEETSPPPPVTGPTPVIVPSADPAHSAGTGRPAPDHDLPGRAPGRPAPDQPAPDQPREAPPEPFEAHVEVDDLTVPLDGSPVQLTARVTNASSVVDGYVLEALTAPEWLAVRPGTAESLPGSTTGVTAELRIVSPALVPAQKLSLLVRLRNTTGVFAYRDMAVRVGVPVVEAPFELRPEPRLLRTRDLTPARCVVVVANPRSNRWVHVRLAASDDEGVVRAAWRESELDVPPGGEARTEVRLQAPPPPAGGEHTRTVHLSATEGQRSADTTVQLSQSTAREAVELLSLSVEPSVVRLGGQRVARVDAVVDNHAGETPVTLTLRGQDPEHALRFAFATPTVQVAAGQRVTVRVDVTAPRTPPGEERVRPFTVTASDGRGERRADGQLVQLAPSRRGFARILLTVAGGLLIMLGTTLHFLADSDESALDLSAQVVSSEIDTSNPSFGIPDELPLLGAEDAVSIGLALLVLGGLVIFGLTGTTGRLTRVSALIAALVLVVTFVGTALLADGSGPGGGAVIIALGCATGYVGGLFARR